MKSKKVVIYISIILMIVSFSAVIIIFNLNVNDNRLLNLISNFCLAIFESAVVTFIISLAEYFVERRKALEIFYDRLIHTMSYFHNIVYIENTEKNKLLIYYDNECINNKVCSDLQKEDYYIKLKQYCIQKNSYYNSISSIDLRREFNSDVIDLKCKFKNTLNSLININFCDLKALGNAYANIDFLLGNRSLRKFIYNSLYVPINDMFNKIRLQIPHFQFYTNGEAVNLPVVYSKVRNLFELLYEEKIHETEYGKRVLVYKRFNDNMEERIEEYRSLMYKCNPEYLKHQPICAYGFDITTDVKVNK